MSLPYFPLYPDDYDAATAHLSFGEDGVYFRLLRHSWSYHEAKMPNDLALLCRKVRANSKRDKGLVQAILKEFFVCKAGKIYNPRLHREWVKAHASHRKRVEAGSAGGTAKALKGNENTPSNAKSMLQQPEPEPEPDLESDSDKKNGGDECASLLSNERRVLEAMGIGFVTNAANASGQKIPADLVELQRWLNLPGLTIDVICDEIARMVRAKTDGRISSFKYFTAAMQRLSGSLTQPPLEAINVPARRERISKAAELNRRVAHLADQLASGQAILDPDRNNPFAILARRDAEARQRAAQDVLPSEQ